MKTLLMFALTAAGPALVNGRIVSAALPKGYQALAGADPDAKAAVESGGVVVRNAALAPSVAPTFGAMPLLGLPVDPSDPKICTAASSGTAADVHGTLARAEVVKLRSGAACLAEISMPGSKLISHSYTWLLSPADKLGVEVVCSYPLGDAQTEQACIAFAESVRAQKR